MKRSPLRLAVFTSQVPWGMSEAFVLTEIAELKRRVGALVVVPVRPRGAMFHGELAREVGENAVRIPLLSVAVIAGAIAMCVRSFRRVVQTLIEVIVGSDSWGVLMRNLAVFPKALYVTGVVQEFGAEHIHAHWASVPATMAFVVSRLTGVPWSFTAHRWDIGENNMLRAKVLAANFARVISLRGRQEVLRIIGEREWSTLRTIHMGTVVSNGLPALRTRDDRGFSIGCIGNLLEVKGHRYLIEACHILRDRGLSYTCHIVGGGPLWAALDVMVAKHGLQDRVRLHGPVPHDRVIEMLRRREFDVVVHPSVRTTDGAEEGIPVALMEALAHRVPVIATETGAIPELLDGGAGILVKPARPEELAEAIERVLLDPGYRTSLGEAGFLRVLMGFNIVTVVDEIVSLIAAVRTEGGRRAAANGK